ncbi:MAG: Na+/H+ antiporter NhaC family protein [Helicobacteraceae bacterium]
MKQIAILLVFSSALLATDDDKSSFYAAYFKAATLIPPVLAIVMAFITKNVILSLFIGVFSGTFLLSVTENTLFYATLDAFSNLNAKVINAMANSWNAGIILQVLTIGGLVALITKMGGTKAVAISLAKRAKSRTQAQISTWFMGLVVFFDDYANSLIVGPVMRPIADRLKISREKLAFIIDSTAAPIAGIAIVSTWIGYELSLIKDAYEIIEVKNINAFAVFLETIGYRFYNIFMLFFVVVTSFTNREFGYMYKAQMRALKDGYLSAPGSSPMIHTEDMTVEPESDIKLRISNAVIPILVLMVTAFAGFYFNGYTALSGDELAAVSQDPLSVKAFIATFGASDASVVLFQAALFASIVAIAMGVWRRIFSINEAINTWLKGLRSILTTIVILLLAWSLSSIIKELGTSKYLVELLSGALPKFVLPSAIFVLASFISFSAGTSYGTMGILMPLIIPLAYAIGAQNGLGAADLHTYMLVNIGAVLTGAIFGDHCSPISDTTILSSMGAACDHIDHTKTQIIYALTVAAISVFFGYLLVGLGVSNWIVLPLGLLATYLTVRFVGKKVE